MKGSLMFNPNSILRARGGSSQAMQKTEQAQAYSPRTRR